MTVTSLGEKFRMNEQMLFSMGFDKVDGAYIYNSSKRSIKMIPMPDGYAVKIVTPNHRFEIFKMSFVDDLMRCAESCGILLHPIIM